MPNSIRACEHINARHRKPNGICGKWIIRKEMLIKSTICGLESEHRVQQSSSCTAATSTMPTKLLNEPKDAVEDMLDGLVASVSHLNRLDGFPEVHRELVDALLAASCTIANLYAGAI